MKDYKSICLLLYAVCLFACKKETNLNEETFSISNATIPQPDHVVIVIEENHAYSQINGSSSAPYINSLKSQGALFTKSYALTHPSQPNYLMLYSGSSQGVTDDNHPANEPFNTANLGKQLIAAGNSFATYSEDLPSIGWNGDANLAYRRKHNPAANWMGTGTNQIPSSTNKRFSDFPADFTQLPTVSYVVPNQVNDMHDGTIADADTWLEVNMDSYIQWCKTNNSMFILTFDEDDRTHNNHIFTLFVGSNVKVIKDTNRITHYSVLRTIEDMYGLAHIGGAVNAASITTVWK